MELFWVFVAIVFAFNSLFEMRWVLTYALGATGRRLAFNSLFEMQVVLEIGFSGFLSFVGGGMWVLCGGFVGCVILVLFFVLVRRVWRCVYVRVC